MTARLPEIDAERRASVALDAIHASRTVWQRQHRRPAALSAREALAAVQFEALLVWAAIATIQTGNELTASDWGRVTLAMRNIDTICSEILG